MSDMVERVARALPLGVGPDPIMDHEFWCVIALRAIAAMRDPTPEMVDSGLCGEGDVNYLGIGENDLAAAYTRMIDAAGKKDGAATD